MFCREIDGCSGGFAEVALAALQESADVLGLLQDRQGAGSGIGADIEALVERHRRVSLLERALPESSGRTGRSNRFACR